MMVGNPWTVDSRGARRTGRPQLALGVLVLVLATARPGLAAWEAPTDPAHHEAEFRAFEGFEYDTGWRPANAAIQVRFAAFLGGGFTCTLDGTSHLTWPDPVTMSFEGAPDGGVFRMDAGFQVTAQLRFSLDVPGYGLAEWEGNIPGIGNIDFRFFDEVVFDPYLLLGANPRTFEVRDRVRRLRVFSIDLTDFIATIPGIGGGLQLEVAGEMYATVSGEQILVDERNVISREGDGVVVPAPAVGPYEGTSRWEGTLTGGGTLLLYPAVYIQIAAWRGALDPFEIPVDLPDVDRRWLSAADPHTFPLPAVRVGPAPLYFPLTDPGTVAERMVAVANDGDALLDATLETEGEGFSIAPQAMQVLPGSSIGALVRFAPERSGGVMGVLRVHSNDPRRPTVLIDLGGVGTATDPVDAGRTDPKDAFAPRDSWPRPDVGRRPDAPAAPDTAGAADRLPTDFQPKPDPGAGGSGDGNGAGPDGLFVPDLGPAGGDAVPSGSGAGSGGCAFAATGAGPGTAWFPAALLLLVFTWAHRRRRVTPVRRPWT